MCFTAERCGPGGSSADWRQREAREAYVQVDALGSFQRSGERGQFIVSMEQGLKGRLADSPHWASYADLSGCPAACSNASRPSS